MFSRFSKWVNGLKTQRDDARAALEQAEKIDQEHGHTHDHIDGVTHAHDHDHAHGDHDFDHRHDHA